MQHRRMALSARRLRNDGERGSVLVELTMIVPFLVLLVVGMLEMGLAWRDSSVVVGSAREGARVAAHLADAPGSDREAIRAIEASLGDLAGDATTITIYRAASADGSVPVNCNNVCNVYDAQTAFSLLDNDAYWECTPSGTALDSEWCPTDRENDIRSFDYIGIRVEVDHDWYAGAFPGDGLTLNSHTVMRLEPDPNGT